jgi:hypothetical protein
MSLLSETTWILIPAMDEAEWLPRCFASLAEQSVKGFRVVVCVNQPDHWWSNEQYRSVCENNRLTLQWLKEHESDFPFECHVLDYSSEGRGWKTGEGGVGWARRVAANEALRFAVDKTILISTDADTLFDPDYLEQILSRFTEFPDAMAIAAPYYHPLTGDVTLDEAMLHYELYLRLMFLNLKRIGSPYAFTAIGSAMAFTAKGYLKAGGYPNRTSGEDFYFLQKIAKTGSVLTDLSAKVYPATRRSNRVPYGTGPALSHPLNELHRRYPIIHPSHFDNVARLYQLFPELFIQNIPTPADEFIMQQFGNTNIWQSLRENAGSINTFTKACHQKFDGLRTWQWLRNASRNDDPDQALMANLQHFLPQFAHQHQNLSLHNTPIDVLSALRDQLFQAEMDKK